MRANAQRSGLTRQPPASAKILMRVATKYPEQVLEYVEDAGDYNKTWP